MDVFDRFVIGDTRSINWCFENTHFIKRLNDNNISRDFIVNTVMNVEPITYDSSKKGMYEVIFPAPESKDYAEIKVVFACQDNNIDLVTVMPNMKTNRQKNRFKNDSYKSVEKKKNLAYAKRKKLY